MSEIKKRKLIIVDFSAMFYIAIMPLLAKDNKSPKRAEKTDMSKIEPEVRHRIIRALMIIKEKFSANFYDYVIACDCGSWRYDIHPDYKWRRKKRREELKHFDHDAVNEMMAMFQRELRKELGFNVISVDRAEGDDIFYALVENLRDVFDNIVMCSPDKDFYQLTVHPNVDYFEPNEGWMSKKRYDPKLFLFKHIVLGDNADDVPNIFKPLDHYKTGDKSQIKMKYGSGTFENEFECFQSVEEINKKRLKMIKENLKRFKENAKLIDLSYCPEDIVEEILETYFYNRGRYKDIKKMTRDDFCEYLTKYKLKELKTKILMGELKY